MEDHDITLYAAELDPNTGVVLREFPICTDPLGQKHAAISGSGDIVVWQGHSRINEDTWTAGIWGFKIGTGQKFLINEGGYEPDISEDGKTVVWDFYTSYENGRDIFGAEIDPNTCEVIEEFPICTAYNGQAVPAISKNFIVWEDHRYYPLPYKPTSLVWPAIYGCDLETQKTFKVCTDPYVWHSYPDISNGSVVWVDTRAGDSHPGRVTNKDIYMAKIPDEMKEVDPDLNLDGIVDSKDFSIFSGSWLEGIRIVEPNESNEPRRR